MNYQEAKDMLPNWQRMFNRNLTEMMLDIAKNPKPPTTLETWQFAHTRSTLRRDFKLDQYIRTL